MKADEGGLFWNTVLEFVWRDQKEPRKTFITCGCHWAEIWTQAHPNTKYRTICIRQLYYLFLLSLSYTKDRSTGVFSAGVKRPDSDAATHFHQILRLQMRQALPRHPPPPHIWVCCRLKQTDILRLSVDTLIEVIYFSTYKTTQNVQFMMQRNMLEKRAGQE
jgi:hypothetical protein